MQLKHRVALNGVQMDSLDSRMMVLSVATQAPQENDVTAQRGGIGTRFIRKQRTGLDVAVQCAMDIKKDSMDEREELMEAVASWAGSLPGWLTTAQKPGRRFRAESVKLPAAGDPFEWTNKYTFTFTAHAVPYWQDSEATEVTITAADENVSSIINPGTEATVCDASLTNPGSETIDSLTVRIGSSSFIFSGLGLEAGETLVISHDEEGLLNIRIRNGTTYRTAMDKRTPESANDLAAAPGSNTIMITAAEDMTGTVSLYGRYK